MSTTELSFNNTEIALMIYLFKKLTGGEKKLYLYKIHKELSKQIDKSMSTILDSLRKLEEKDIVKPIVVSHPKGKRSPSRYYHLTPFGAALAETLLMRKRFTM